MSGAARRRLVVEADGGSRGNPGVAGYGALVRDAATGELLAERAAPIGKASNNVAEYSGLIAGLEAVLLIDAGAAVEVKMDSKLVIEQMAGRWKIKHVDMQRLALEARDVVRQITEAGGSLTWTWIPREINKDADKLSNDGMDGETVERDLWNDADSPSAQADSTILTEEEAEDVAEEQVLSTDQTPAKAPDVGAPTRVLLVRHGVTDFTVEHRLDGRGGADPSLNAEGQEQARRAAAGVAARVAGSDGSVHVVTSSLARAKQTGAAVAEALGVEAAEDADWDEQAFGEWDGLSFSEILEQYPGQMQRLRLEDDYAVAGGGETNTQLTERVEKAFARAVALAGPGGTVIIATHRKPIMSVLASVLGITGAKAWRLAAAPASLTGLEIWSDEYMSVAFVNDTSHHHVG